LFFAVTNLVSVLAICYVLYAGCYMPSLICQFLYVECHVLATVSLQSYQFIWQSQLLYAECYGLYAKLHMLDCNMSNAMTIPMSFSMTTEQVGHIIIYIYLLSGYDSPYCRYREEITIIPPWLQFISQVSGISVC
jgi:hypothetical protein